MAATRPSSLEFALASSPQTARSALTRARKRTPHPPHAASLRSTVQTGYLGGGTNRAHGWHLIRRGAGGRRALEIEHTDGPARRIHESRHAPRARFRLVPRVRHFAEDRRQVQAAIQAAGPGRPRGCIEGTKGDSAPDAARARGDHPRGTEESPHVGAEEIERDDRTPARTVLAGGKHGRGHPGSKRVDHTSQASFSTKSATNGPARGDSTQRRLVHRLQGPVPAR